MPEQVFEIDALKKRVLELLRRHASFMGTGSVAMQLGVPSYAADAALEAARREGQLEFAPGAGWRALDQEPPRPTPADEAQQAISWTGGR